MSVSPWSQYHCSTGVRCPLFLNAPIGASAGASHGLDSRSVHPAIAFTMAVLRGCDALRGGELGVGEQTTQAVLLSLGSRLHPSLWTPAHLYDALVNEASEKVRARLSGESGRQAFYAHTTEVERYFGDAIVLRKDGRHVTPSHRHHHSAVVADVFYSDGVHLPPWQSRHVFR